MQITFLALSYCQEIPQEGQELTPSHPGRRLLGVRTPVQDWLCPGQSVDPVSQAGKEKVASRFLHQNLTSLIRMTRVEYNLQANKI